MSSKTCGNCLHFETSAKAAQRAVLDGYGYCKAAPTVELRARFIRADSTCWLPTPRWEATK